MKVSVSEDSWYPVYTLNESFSLMDDTIEIPDAIYKSYIKIINDFEHMQNEIRQFQIEQNDYEYDKHSSWPEVKALRMRRVD